MDFDIMKIFDVIILALGVYIAFCAVRLKSNNVPSTLIPPELLKKCRNVEGLCTRLFGPTCLFAFVSLLYGVYSSIFDFQLVTVTSQVNSIINVALILLFIVGWVYFSYVLRKATEEFCG